jgi:hypothetical protein
LQIEPAGQTVNEADILRKELRIAEIMREIKELLGRKR